MIILVFDGYEDHILSLFIFPLLRKSENFVTFWQIVSKDLSDPVRSHKDLDKDAAPFFRKAVQFYEELAKQLVNQGHVLDLFASAVDQVQTIHNMLTLFFVDRHVLVVLFLPCQSFFVIFETVSFFC